MEFKIIQQKLNKLCIQHDEYMSLLDIVDYLGNIKNLTQINKNNLNKINGLEISIKQMFDLQTTQRVQQKQLGLLKIQKFKKNITQIQSKLQEYNTILSQFDINLNKIQKDNTLFAHNRQVQNINNQLQNIIENNVKNTSAITAMFNNDLTEQTIRSKNILSNISNINNTSNNGNIKQIVNEVCKKQIDQYDKLYHQILYYKLQFPSPSYMQFIQFNTKQIKQQIDNLFQLINSQQQSLSQQDYITLKHQIQITLFYRIKSLKNYALCQLLQQYQTNLNQIQIYNKNRQRQ